MSANKPEWHMDISEHQDIYLEVLANDLVKLTVIDCGADESVYLTSFQAKQVAIALQHAIEMIEGQAK